MALKLRSVLVTDHVDSVCADVLRQGGLRVVCKNGLMEDQLINEMQDHDGLIVRSATSVTSRVLQESGVKLVGRAGTGVDNIDCEAATRQGVMVINTPSGNSLSAAEHTCAMLMSISRNIPQACGSLKTGTWERKAFMGTELYGKTLAILGLGRIGREVAVRMQSFGMKTVGFDPVISTELASSIGVEKKTLDEVWECADYITVHTPLIPQTKNLINSTSLSRCKKGVKIINVARGGIIDEAALLEALKSGQCGGAGLDVFEQEPPQNPELLGHPQVVCTPHLGASTVEAQKRVAKEVAEQFVNAARGSNIMGVVNGATLGSALTTEWRPWTILAQGLGTILASVMTSSALHGLHVTITSFGPGLERRAFLTPASLVGLMRGMTPNGINMINAPLLAKEMEIKVTQEHRTVAPACTNADMALQLTVALKGLEHTIIGSVQGETPVLYQIDSCVFENGVTFTNNILFYRGPDDPCGLANIISGLAQQNAAISTVFRSNQGINQNVVYAVRTNQSLSSPERIKIPETQFVAQCAF